MIRPLLIAALFYAVQTTAKTERVWLVIAASDATPAGIARQAKTLVRTTPAGLVVQTADCGETKNVFAWAAAVADSAEDAQTALPRVRSTAKDAYIKRCDVKPRSLLSFRFPAVDISIGDVLQSAVNWDDEDRISTVLPLSDGRTLIVARRFDNKPNDPLEGKRERVLLAGAPGQPKLLEDNCPRAGQAVVDHGRLAFHCAREQAADQLLHSVLVFDASGKKVVEMAHCRNPRWSDSQVIVCDEESVGPDGRLRLREKRTELAGKADASAR